MVSYSLSETLIHVLNFIDEHRSIKLEDTIPDHIKYTSLSISKDIVESMFETDDHVIYPVIIKFFEEYVVR